MGPSAPDPERTELDCDEFRIALGDSESGRIEAERRRALEAHASACAACERLMRSRRGRPPRIVALAFLAAFGASILTLIYTGLSVRGTDRADGFDAPAEPERAAAAADDRRTGAETDPGTDDDDADAARAPAR